MKNRRNWLFIFRNPPQSNGNPEKREGGEISKTVVFREITPITPVFYH